MPSSYVTEVNVDGLGYSKLKCLSSHVVITIEDVSLSISPLYVEAYLKHLVDDSSNYQVTDRLVLDDKKLIIKKVPYFNCDKIKVDHIVNYINSNPALLNNKKSFNDLEFLNRKLTANVAHIKGSKYVAADDEDIENDASIDSDLKDIIKRVVKIWDGPDYYGSGLLLGEKCDKIITAKHNVYDQKTGYRYDKSKAVKVESKSYGSVPVFIDSSIPKWHVSDEGIILDLGGSLKRKTCKKIPLVTRENFKAYKNCRIIGFPSIKGVDSPVKGYTHEKRAIAKCSLSGMSTKGTIYNTCSTFHGASGSPIVCKVDDWWSYVAVNDGDQCEKNGIRGSAEYCYNADSPLEYNDNFGEGNLAVSRAGSISDKGSLFD